MSTAGRARAYIALVFASCCTLIVILSFRPGAPQFRGNALIFGPVVLTVALVGWYAIASRIAPRQRPESVQPRVQVGIRIVTAALFGVAMSTFFTGLHGVPEVHRSGYFDDNHGTLTRLTYSQYLDEVVREQRLVNGIAACMLLGVATPAIDEVLRRQTEPA